MIEAVVLSGRQTSNLGVPTAEAASMIGAVAASDVFIMGLAFRR